MTIMKGYQDLLIWQVGMDLVEKIYRLSDGFPPHERFGLTSQMRRAVVSIPSNIAEGYRRKTDADFLQFLHITFGSASEIETQTLIALRLNYYSKEEYDQFDQMLAKFFRLLTGFIQSRNQKSR